MLNKNVFWSKKYGLNKFPEEILLNMERIKNKHMKENVFLNYDPNIKPKRQKYEIAKKEENDDGMWKAEEIPDVPNKANYKNKEYGVKRIGPEPTRYNDWEWDGRCSDF